MVLGKTKTMTRDDGKLETAEVCSTQLLLFLFKLKLNKFFNAIIKLFIEIVSCIACRRPKMKEIRSLIIILIYYY